MGIFTRTGWRGEEQHQRLLKLDAEWEAYAAELPPDWWDIHEPDLDSYPDIFELPWHQMPARPTGPLPKIEVARAVELLRRSRCYGIEPPPQVAPDAPYRRRGEVEPRPIARTFKPLREAYATSRRNGWREMYATEEERDLAWRLYGEQAIWLEAEVARIGPYDPGLAATTLEAAGYWDSRVISDYWFLAGDLHASIDVLEDKYISRRLNLRRFLSDEISAEEVGLLAWWGSDGLTSFARDRREEFLSFVVASAEAILAEVGGLIERIFAVESLAWAGWKLYGCRWSEGTELDLLLQAKISPNVEARGIVRDMARTAENMYRDSLGVPSVGEGWVSETALFRAIEAAFGSLTPVVHHGRPEGFGLQHLDVWLPEWRIGLEYQGLQHDAPVEFFGGQEAFEANQKRDAEKRRKAKRLGIHLIEVRPGFDFDHVVAEIEKARRAIAEAQVEGRDRGGP